MAGRIKILSDFDGVWTNQSREADQLIGHTIATLADALGVSAQEARRDIAVFCETMGASPSEHGWAPDGRISAYVDEDPLIESSALCRLIETSPDPRARAYRDAVLGRGTTMAAFAEGCFRDATDAFRTHAPCLIDDAAGVLDALRDAGAEVIIISNSRADKIGAWFGAAGIDAGEGPGHALRLRGSAAKWLLGEGDEAIEIGGRRVHVDRPRYRAAIEQEDPDLIIGDVFSLDLALPHVMRTGSHAGAPRRLALRRHAHTPPWILDGRADGAIDHVVDGVDELPAIVRRLLAE